MGCKVHAVRTVVSDFIFPLLVQFGASGGLLGRDDNDNRRKTLGNKESGRKDARFHATGADATILAIMMMIMHCFHVTNHSTITSCPWQR